MSRLRVRYQTVEFAEFDIHLRTLRDRQQFQPQSARAAEALGVSPASWALFGVVWDSGRALAARLSDLEVDGLRILEVGCGIALPSHVLNERGADITATDYNPDAGAFLDRNTALNERPRIPFVLADWADLSSDMGRFDLIVASDVLYEPDQVINLSRFVERHAAPAAVMLLVDPGRGFLNRFTRKMADLGFSNTRESVPLGDDGKTAALVEYFRSGPA